MPHSHAPVEKYDLMSRLNHWILAILMIGMIGYGFYIFEFMENGPSKRPMIGLHKSVGFLVLVLGAWRVVWRMGQGFKKDVGNPSIWMSWMVKFVHILLLAGILFMPISGLVGSYFSGRATSIFGWFSIPAGPKSDTLSDLAYCAHSIFAYVLVGAIILHIVGSLKHHFIDRDTTLKRMM